MHPGQVPAAERRRRAPGSEPVGEFFEGAPEIGAGDLQVFLGLRDDEPRADAQQPGGKIHPRVVPDHEALVGPPAEESQGLSEVMTVRFGAAHDLGAGDQREGDPLEPRPTEPRPDGLEEEDGVRGDGQLVPERQGHLEQGASRRSGGRKTAQLLELRAVESREDPAHFDRGALDRARERLEKDPVERVGSRAVGRHLPRGGGQRRGDARQFGRFDETTAGEREVGFQESGHVDVEEGAVEVEEQGARGRQVPSPGYGHGACSFAVDGDELRQDSWSVRRKTSTIAGSR